jgi:hypothetical protein
VAYHAGERPVKGGDRPQQTLVGTGKGWKPGHAGFDKTEASPAKGYSDSPTASRAWSRVW